MRVRETTKIYVRGISTNVKRIFKAYCAREGISMNRAIEHLMRDCVRKNVNLTRLGRDLQREQEENEQDA